VLLVSKTCDPEYRTHYKVLYKFSVYLLTYLLTFLYEESANGQRKLASDPVVGQTNFMPINF